MPVIAPPTEHQELLERVAAGNRDSYAALVGPHLPALLGFAARLAPSRAAAEDALQDVLAQAYQTLQRKPAHELARLQIRPWLFKSVVNRLRRVGRVNRELASGLAVQGRPIADVEAVVERRAELSLLVTELVKLPTPWRAAILLRHQGGYSYEEIASILARPCGTVKAWVHRGTQRVREALVDQQGRERQ